MSDKPVIDLRGMKCPSPIVHLNEVVNDLAPGDDFLAIADDRAFEPDVQAWCDLTGNELLSLEHAEADIRALIRRAER